MSFKDYENTKKCLHLSFIILFSAKLKISQSKDIMT